MTTDKPHPQQMIDGSGVSVTADGSISHDMFDESGDSNLNVSETDDNTKRYYGK